MSKEPLNIPYLKRGVMEVVHEGVFLCEMWIIMQVMMSCELTILTSLEGEEVNKYHQPPRILPC